MQDTVSELEQAKRELDRLKDGLRDMVSYTALYGDTASQYAGELLRSADSAEPPTELRSQLAVLPPSTLAVIDAAMALFEVFRSSADEVTIQALVDGFSLALSSDGCEVAVYLAMLSNAVRIAKPPEKTAK